MNKENKGAAGLRRSAIAERIRLREEWSALKEIGESVTSTQSVPKKKQMNSRCTPIPSTRKKQITSASTNRKGTLHPVQVKSDVLIGVVAFVDVGSEAQAFPLRAALAALGASVLTAWSPLVTHVVWTDNGNRSIRARARALACRLVSPLWVEACAAATEKLNEKMFPSTSRLSDLPSPRTLRALLKKAERENIPLADLLSDSKEEDKVLMPRLRLRISSGTDTSRDKTTDTSNDTIDIESRVNTAPRRGATIEPRRPIASPITRPSPKSKRKLFTHKEAPDISSDEDSDTTVKTKQNRNKLTQNERRDLVRAERMAKKLLAACNTQNTQRSNNNNNIACTQNGLKPKIVLSGMSRMERQAITKCIQTLGGIIQNKVNKRTTHVLMGSCNSNLPCTNHPSNITGITGHCDLSKSSCWTESLDKRARTLNSLLGAARGARVLYAKWAVLSAEKGHWLHHHGYEVQHLKKISQKALVERSALDLLNRDYAYDVFDGMRIRVSEDADQRDAAIELLTLCGAVVQNGGAVTQDGDAITQDGGAVTQNGGDDVTIGNNAGEVNSKWVFDSVAAARVRTTRRYLNINHEQLENRSR